MSVVVGFTWPIEHDNAAVAIVDGKLVFATEEERHTRHRHSVEEAPIRSLIATFNFLKSEFGIIPTDVKTFATNWNPSLGNLRDKRSYVLDAYRSFANSDIDFPSFGIRLDAMRSYLRGD